MSNNKLVKAYTLQPPERERFELLKKSVTDGMAVCFIVGASLREIKERKFYLADGYETFEAFCDGEWGWTKRYCNQLILDSKAINSLPPSMRKLITSHEAARTLAEIPESLRAGVVDMASLGGKKAPTARDIKKATPPPPRPSKSPPPKPAKKSSPPNRPSPKPSSSRAPKDHTGVEIPVEIIDRWNRGGDIQALLTYVSTVRSAVKEARDEKDNLFVEIDFTNNLALLSQVYEDLKRAQPFAVCPDCQGKLPDDCTTCKGRGFVSEFFWKTFVPEEKRNMRKP